MAMLPFMFLYMLSIQPSMTSPMVPPMVSAMNTRLSLNSTWLHSHVPANIVQYMTTMDVVIIAAKRRYIFRCIFFCIAPSPESSWWPGSSPPCPREWSSLLLLVAMGWCSVLSPPGRGPGVGGRALPTSRRLAGAWCAGTPAGSAGSVSPVC
ncbi:hypothetical protein [Blastococcus sp. MG754426]|uniref:hypothetical protein n=1 Tax=Blastococcus sp. MG754426 TaxID=2570317 RepID=UPI001F1CAECA|nr:hypothetical protein [Blastococcus sp. MG754426]